MKEENKLKSVLIAYKNGNINLECAIDFILHIFSVSKRFNSNSFLIGIIIGLILALIYFHIII